MFASVKCLSILSISIFTFGIISRTECATFEDAQTAFEGLRQIGESLINEASAQVSNLHNLTRTRLQSIETATLNELYAKLDDVNRTITRILDKAQRTGVLLSRCSWGTDVGYARFPITMEERIRDCTSKNTELIDQVILEIYHFMDKARADTLACNSRSMIQCSWFEVNRNNTSCFDFVVRNIEKAKEDLAEAFAGYSLVMENKVETVRLPCGDLIKSQIDLYPTLFLNHVTSCVNTHSKLIVPYLCS